MRTITDRTGGTSNKTPQHSTLCLASSEALTTVRFIPQCRSSGLCGISLSVRAPYHPLQKRGGNGVRDSVGVEDEDPERKEGEGARSVCRRSDQDTKPQRQDVYDVDGEKALVLL
ncbi:hypothetical protein MHYP_G00168090 [Metynnis hypsauchen]